VVRALTYDPRRQRISAVQVIDAMRPRALAESIPPGAVRRDSLPTAASGTASTVAASASGPGSRPWIMRGVVALLAVAIVALVALRGLDARKSRSAGATPAVSGALAVVAPAPAPLTIADPVPPTEGASAAPTGTPAPAEARSAPRPKPRGGKPAPSVAPRPTQDPCDPPFSLDESGRKHFKLNCVN